MTMANLQPASQGIADAIVIPVVLTFPMPKMPAGAGRFDALHSAVLPANGWPHPSASNLSSVPHTRKLEDKNPSSILEVQDGPGDRPIGPDAEQTLEALRARAAVKIPNKIVKSDLPSLPERAGMREPFGQNASGANDLLARLAKAPVALLSNATRETLAT